MHKSFKSKVVVTGAVSGLRLAIAKKLSQYKVRAALFDNIKDLLLKLQKEFPKDMKFYVVDIANEEAIKKPISETVKHFGSIDILVNGAEITGKTNIKSHEVEYTDLKSVFVVNFLSSFYTSKYVLPLMLKNNYSLILHIASIAGKEGNADMLAYSA